MKSNNYEGIDALRALAASMAVTLDKPSLVGQDWWVTASFADGRTYQGDTREVNAFLQGYQRALADTLPPASPLPSGGHSFDVRCGYCLDEPFDVADVNGPCPENQEDNR